MRTAFASLLVVAALQSSAFDSELGLALRAGQVSLSVTGLGGHSGGCVRVEAVNRTGEQARIVIPSGWRFGSQDSTLQDLLVVGEQVLALAPNGRATVTCAAFCCEASMGGPGAGSGFNQGWLADSALVKLARHMASTAYDEQAMQQAVWAVSDGSPISGIDAGEASATHALRQFVATLTGRPVPWYTTAFAEATDGRAFNPNATHVSGRVEFQQRHAGVLSIVVKDASGATIHVLDEGRELRQGKYSIEVDVTVRNWPQGRYAICFATDGVLLERKEFDL